MAKREIIILPDKRLRLKSAQVEKIDKSVRALVDDMFETMYEAPGIGLAAIQIGVPQRVVTMDLAKKDEPKQPQVFINPEITWTSDDKAIAEEGCLSIPDIYGDVERPAQVRVRALNVDGQAFEVDADELLARCLQHEIDHLHGKLFIDYLSVLKRRAAMAKWNKEKAKYPGGIRRLTAAEVAEHHHRDEEL